MGQCMRHPLCCHLQAMAERCLNSTVAVTGFTVDGCSGFSGCGDSLKEDFACKKFAFL